MRRQWLSVSLFLLAIAGLLGGLAWLIHLRFESGRAYAQRSSLRSDPLGSKALHDAYAELPNLRVSRNFVPLVQLPELPPGATLLLLNTGGGQLHPLADAGVVVDFVEKGGRLVVALDPGRIAYEHLEDEQADEHGEEADTDTGTGGEHRSFTRRGHAETDFFWKDLALRHGKHTGGEAERTASADALLPESLSWREGGVLVEFDADAWSPLYQIDDEVVAARRSYGAGEIVVLTDDYLFSNEALLKHRFPRLFAWVLRGKSELIFEETHLGVSERAGIATLVRRYRLDGFAIAFTCLMGLIVWRGAMPLLPPFGGRAEDRIVRPEHSIEAGLGDLLHRSLPPSALPKAAFEAWKRTFIRNEADRRHYAAELDEAETLLQAQESLPPRRRKPVETHLTIKSIINRKKRRRQ